MGFECLGKGVVVLNRKGHSGNHAGERENTKDGRAVARERQNAKSLLELLAFACGKIDESGFAYLLKECFSSGYSRAVTSSQ